MVRALSAAASARITRPRRGRSAFRVTLALAHGETVSTPFINM